MGEDKDYRLRRISVGQQDKPKSLPSSGGEACGGATSGGSYIHHSSTSPGKLETPKNNNKKILDLAKQCAALDVS